MTPRQAGLTMKAARKLLRRGKLKAYDMAVLDCLLWSCRTPGAAWATVSLANLSKLTSLCKESVVAALGRIQATGMMKKHKRRMKVKWALGWASRQMTNRYEFRPLSEFFTESVPATVIGVIGIKKEQNMLDKVLDRLRGLTFAPIIDAGLVV